MGHPRPPRGGGRSGDPRELHGASYVGSAACGTCHAEHAASWRRTFHRTMTQEARPGTVAGDFANATYTYDGVTARMHRDANGRFLMTFAPAAGGAGVDAVIVRAVGSRRYQQYLAEVDGALWRLPVAYHVEEQRWFHMNGAFLTPDPAGDAPDEQPTPGRARGSAAVR